MPGLTRLIPCKLTANIVELIILLIRPQPKHTGIGVALRRRFGIRR